LTLTNPPNSLLLTFPQDQMQLTPRFWAGYESETGLSARVRYWQFDGDLAAEQYSFAVGPIGPLPAGSVLSSSGHLDMYTADIEVAQRASIGCWGINLGGGIRTAGITHSTALTITPAAPAVTLAQTDEFTGVGPTLFADLRRPLGTTNFALVLDGRSSLLFGPWAQQSSATGAIALPTPLVGAAAPYALVERSDAFVAIAEARLGAEWSRPISRLGGKIFANIMFEAQTWAGSASLLTSSNRDIGLLGFSGGVGLSR
jgi:hypothetical protein